MHFINFMNKTHFMNKQSGNTKYINSVHRLYTLNFEIIVKFLNNILFVRVNQSKCV